VIDDWQIKRRCWSEATGIAFRGLAQAVAANESTPVRSAGLRFLKQLRPEGTIDHRSVPVTSHWMSRTECPHRPSGTELLSLDYPALRTGLLSFYRRIRTKKRSRRWLQAPNRIPILFKQHRCLLYWLPNSVTGYKESFLLVSARLRPA
jgi:hypothetical protein